MARTLTKILVLLSICVSGVANPLFFGQNYTAIGGSSGTNILDITPTASFAAYSFSRKLRDGYSGAPFKVRRASDNSIRDAIFDVNGVTDVADLASFCAGTDGFITIVYDQSGNGRNLTNDTATTQPKIVSAGTVLTGSNGRAAATFDGTDDFLQSAPVTVAQPLTYFSVLTITETSDGKVILSAAFTTGAAMRHRIDDTIALNAGTWLFIATKYTKNTWYAFKTSFVGGNGEIKQNGTSIGTGAVGANGGSALLMGYFTAGTGAGFKISEWIVFKADITGSSETTINSNENDFYILY